MSRSRLKRCTPTPHVGSSPVAAVGRAGAQCRAMGRGASKGPRGASKGPRGASKGPRGSAAAGHGQGALSRAGDHWSRAPAAGHQQHCSEQQLPACTPICWRWLLCLLHDRSALLEDLSIAGQHVTPCSAAALQHRGMCSPRWCPPHQLLHHAVQAAGSPVQLHASGAGPSAEPRRVPAGGGEGRQQRRGNRGRGRCRPRGRPDRRDQQR